jgi:hypothetical protein
MIGSADEFVRLRSSENPDEYHRAANEDASAETWLDVIDRHPDMRFWVAQNKTVPLDILELLRHDPDARLRSMVRAKDRGDVRIRTIASAAEMPSRSRSAQRLSCAYAIPEHYLRIDLDL